ncbi:MAG: autotransporter outer membrane beta-barrel domain-containing protein [Desulfovibrionaceae bacterium]|nr:autotransporter outer membrane beta-barrel domain-containing protein [Desulfovibrionaceae bacterium]
MPQKSIFVFLACLAALFAAPRVVQAETSVFVPESGDFFEFVMLEPGEFGDDDSEPPSAFNLNDDELNSLRVGAEYWRAILQPGSANTRPVKIQVRMVDEYDDNASASSLPLREGPYAGMFELSGAIAGNWFGADGDGFDENLAWVTIDHGKLPSGEWYVGPMASLPQNGDLSDLASTVLHELGHALGIGAFSHEEYDDGKWYFNEHLDNWTKGLRDMYGKPARPNMEITMDGNSDPDSFVMEDKAQIYRGVYFTGKHVQEVLNGAYINFPKDPRLIRDQFGTDPVPGLPINAWEGYDRGPELSHIELQNSLMSHQDYRNWNTLMEAELAALQDLGLKIDRRNFYGYSVYNNNLQNLVNNNPYFARNAAGTGWLTGQPNTTPWGVGLHVYGVNNKITQAADLLADGLYALGIRVDGWENKLTIAPGARVQANGEGGTGLLVSYGKNHILNLRGSVTATGEDGIAVRLDFGDNEMGNRTQYRGSYILVGNYYNSQTQQYEPIHNLLDELNGPLIKQLDVTGTLKGSRAAIYIGENAYVEEINIMSGAQISGDIISEWDENLVTHHPGGDLHTSLTFGLKPNSDGTASAASDSAFNMTLHGGISGPESLDMSVEGGRLNVTGPVEAFSLANKAHLGLYGMNAQNRGALVTADFSNAADATLETGFMAAGQVAGVLAETAQVDGVWALTPLQDYYDGSDIYPAAAVMLTDGSTVTDFSSVILGENPSPTIDYALLSSDPDAPLIGVSRSPDAYSRYADNPGAAGAGRALYQISGLAQGDMQNLFAAIDFSGKDGSGVRSGLAQLNPEAYDVGARVSLQQQQQINTMISQRLRGRMHKYRSNAALASENVAPAAGDNPQENTLPATDAQEWQAWFMPFGSHMNQDNYHGVSGWSSYGLGTLAGVDKTLDSGLTFGMHLAAAVLDTDIRGHHDAELTTHGFYLGAHALHSPEAWDGFYLSGQARIGVENSEMKRNIAINGYERKTKSDWTGVAGSALLGAGKDWAWNNIYAGPLAWVEYGFTHRPDVNENGGGAVDLALDDKFYQSLSFALGAHVGTVTQLTEQLDLQADMMAAWKHELLDDPFHSPAAFRGYESAGFESATELTGRDAMLLQGSLRLDHEAGVYTELNLGAELFRQSSQAVNVSLNFGWEF